MLSDDTLNEIRINHQFTQHLRSEFTKGTEEESTPLIRKSIIPTPVYLKKIMSNLDSFNGILPPNCRFIEKLSSGNLVVIEEPPAYRTIKVDYSMLRELSLLKHDNKIKEWNIDEAYYSNSSNKPFTFNLAFPYVVFIMSFDRSNGLQAGSVYLRNARLAGYSDYLLKMPMMNISDDQYICYGNSAGHSHNTLNAAIENTIMVFWSAVFNEDYTYNYSAYKNVAGVNTYIGWQALSQIDPMFIYNIEWVKMNENLNQTLDNIKNHVSGVPKNAIQFNSLASIFTQPVDSGKEEKVRRKGKSKRTSRLFYDIAQGIYLNDRFFFHVGDPIIWGKHKAYVDSFIGFFESDTIRLIRIQFENGKLVNVRFNSQVADYMLQTAKQLRFDEQGTMKNGEVIKEDDIVIMKVQDRIIYRRVHFIRKARDGVTEARLGNSFYILENTEGTVLDAEEPKYRERKLQKNTPYLLFNIQESVPLSGGVEVTYDKLDVNKKGSLKMNFISHDSYKRKHDMVIDNSANRILLYEDEYEKLPPIFRVGRKLYGIRYDGGLDSKRAWATHDGIAYNTRYNLSKPTISEIEKYLLSSDGSSLSFESFDLNVEFKIGDKVVCADWTNPINMLIVKTITAFKIDKETFSLSFVLSDKDGQLTEVVYIKNVGSDNDLNIHIGRIRKITNEFGPLTAGTKIISEKGYIPHFPKKDTNIIIGFITDTGGDEPLVLCSNCCTLWFNDVMEHFKHIPIKSKKWPTLLHAPIDITKIKFQAGDIINGITDYKTDIGWLVCHMYNSRTMKISPLRSYTSYLDISTLDNYIKNCIMLDCIPNPRINPTRQNEVNIERAWPNFHGLFTRSTNSHFQFLEDERSLIHVQDSHK